MSTQLLKDTLNETINALTARNIELEAQLRQMLRERKESKSKLQKIPLKEIVESECNIAALSLALVDAMLAMGEQPGITHSQRCVLSRVISDHGIRGMLSGYTGASNGFDLGEIENASHDALESIYKEIYPNGVTINEIPKPEGPHGNS